MSDKPEPTLPGPGVTPATGDDFAAVPEPYRDRIGTAQLAPRRRFMLRWGSCTQSLESPGG